VTELDWLARYFAGQLGPAHDFKEIIIDECAKFTKKDFERLADQLKWIEFYRGKNWLRFQYTPFGSIVRWLGIPTRWFPVRWVGAWVANR
jgi:hypothetical protein